MGAARRPRARVAGGDRVEPDTPYAVLAGNVLHPKSQRGLPGFIPSFAAPAEIVRLAPRRQLDALRQRAEEDGAGAAAVQRRASARGTTRLGSGGLRACCACSPANAEAQVAAAVGQFDKDAPERAFGRLGPLTRTFPGEPSVRFHLGVLLIWTGRVTAAERQFRLATRTQPGSPLAREAARYLETIRHARSQARPGGL